MAGHNEKEWMIANSTGRSGEREMLSRYKAEMEAQLESILSWWMRWTPDAANGGFVGRVDHNNVPYPESPKGSVLNSRILWAFSCAYNFTRRKDYLNTAERAFNYFTNYFVDKKFGGVYWTIDCHGQPLDDKKQIYALAFAVYSFSEHYLASGDEGARDLAIQVYNDILVHSYDEEYGGYIEALTRDWHPLDDLRLSLKDANEKKSMNTHLHLLEAFANLYRVWKDESLRGNIIELIRIFLDHIVDHHSHHLILFFDEQWNTRSGVISYGHDIEAAWLMQEAAEIIGDKFLLNEVKTISVKIADAAAQGLDKDGGLWHEYDPLEKKLVRQKHSWPQAEAMIGFFNAWQLTGNTTFLQRSLQSWEFVKRFLLDRKFGEWYWGVNTDYSPMLEEDKVGIWKCPYHNSRACMEIIRRINYIIMGK